MLGYRLLASFARGWSLYNIADKVGDRIRVLFNIPKNHDVWIVMVPFIVHLLCIPESEGPSSIQIGEIGFGGTPSIFGPDILTSFAWFWMFPTRFLAPKIQSANLRKAIATLTFHRTFPTRPSTYQSELVAKTTFLLMK